MRPLKKALLIEIPSISKDSRPFAFIRGFSTAIFRIKEGLYVLFLHEGRISVDCDIAYEEPVAIDRDIVRWELESSRETMNPRMDYEAIF